MNSHKAVTRFKATVIVLALSGLLGGCATSGNPKDPIEGFNRAMFAFNEGLDTVLIKPVAQGYDTVLPTPVKTGVTNFFGNIADLFIGVNALGLNMLNNSGSDFGAIGPAIGEGATGEGAVRWMARAPEQLAILTRTMLVGQAVSESTGIYSLVISLILIFVV